MAGLAVGAPARRGLIGARGEENRWEAVTLRRRGVLALHSGAVVPPDRVIGRPAPRARDQVMGEAVTVTVTAGIGVPGVVVGVRSTCSRSISCSGFTLVRCSSRGLFSFSTNERCWLHGIDCVWPYCQLYGRAR